MVGIIYPPPEVRNIVDKTASFVARNGPEFEARIRQNEINNPKFNFLNPNDPYHAYYRHKVSEFKEGKAQEPSAAIPKVMQQQQQATQQQLPQKVSSSVSPHSLNTCRKGGQCSQTLQVRSRSHSRSTVGLSCSLTAAEANPEAQAV